MPVSRRHFLEAVGRAGGYSALYTTMQGMGLMAAAPAYAGTPKLPAGSGAGVKVAILGGGIGGLVAAYELGKAGYDVTVLEALARPGGRSWTLRRGDRVRQIGRPDQVVDWEPGPNRYFNAGPGRIPQSHHAILAYCRELGVPMEVMVNSNRAARLDFKGRVVANRQATNDTRGVFAELLGKAVDKGALDQELTGQDKERFLDFLGQYGALDGKRLYGGADRAGLATEAGAFLQAPVSGAPLRLGDMMQADFWGVSLFFDELLEMQATMLQPVGGMDRIVQALHARVKPAVRFGSIIRQIRRRDDGVRIVYARGGREEALDADYAICTLPLSVLTPIPADFESITKRAIAAPSYVKATKLAWETRRFWEQDDGQYGGMGWTDQANASVWYPSGGLGEDRGILVGAYVFDIFDDPREAQYAGLSVAQRAEVSRRVIERMHPGRGRELARPVSVAWSQTEYAGGVGANWSEAQRKAEYAHLCKPDGPVYFAGEHMSYLNGWQEGAVLSAQEVVRQLHTRTRAA
jgi:monoamine oxidase